VQANNLSTVQQTSGNLIMVGTAKSNETLAMSSYAFPTDKSFVAITPARRDSDWLVVGGSDSEGVEKAGLDLIRRYWIHAKDSAARRVGLVEKKLPRGLDPTKLP
jgi:hypothetical protein